MAKTHSSLLVENLTIRLYNFDKEDYFSLTDMAKKSNPRTEIVIQNWMRSRNTVEFLGLWESLNNPNFNHIEFDVIKSNVGLNTFVLSVSDWVNSTNAIGIRASAGRYGGTYAHKDIAFEFGSWLNPSFKLLIIKEFQRLKTDESTRLGLDWNLKRQLAKANWHIHTEAVREHLVPIIDWNTRREAYAQASEADLLNLALFGMTSREWKAANPDLSGNLRDHASTEQLLVLANLQSLNAKLLEWDSPKEQRLEILNKTAREQMDILVNTRAIQNINQLTEGNQGLLGN
ncbi:MAG: KilA-N domain-containing protein [Bacteroidetes bacterium]|nr:KilA-N domain-containing protein [Bacteroidota bacterium]